jgi:alpha-D-xyloside xylohydrolase
MKTMRKILVLLIGLAPFTLGVSETIDSFATQSDGVLCYTSGGKLLKLQVCAGNIIRVVYTAEATIPAPQGFVISQTAFNPGTISAADNGTAIVLTTPLVTASVTKSNAAVSFANSSGTTICSEVAGGRNLIPVTRSGQAGDSGTLQFNSPASEAVYGLGNLSESSGGWTETDYWCSTTLPPDRTGQINGRSWSFDMHQTNWMDIIPFFMTTSGYGVLMNFCCHATKSSPLNFTASFLLNNSWDYFYIYGPQFDSIIAGYRNLTGQAPMLPKWAYGFWQCKNRYSSSDSILIAVSAYRQDSIPVDCIVQDWDWWTAYGSFTWGSTYTSPPPSSWISTIHSDNCHFALSIWSTFVSGTSNYTAMQPHFITDSCNSATAGNYMDPFDTTALSLFWGYINSSAFSNGVDAWWCDATEPECDYLHSMNTNLGAIETYANAYPIAQAKNIYENQRAVSTAKRVVNLTRSFYAGQQRYSTMYWNGDLSGSDMGNVATTVSGGINLSMAGYPYWCSDIGGFQNNPTDDILSRWFEAGTFFPIFRVHGSRATEIYNMDATVRPIATAYDLLRYRLLPYIYSLAWMETNQAYTMTRALWFDFPGDTSVKNIADQYMFGPALLINPVHTANATSRNLYLPAGTWYNFWTGTSATYATGTTLTNVSAPSTIIPIYARAGAILPMGPKIRYAAQKQADTIELRVYTGANGSFTLYEDEGDNYNYETGAYATIPITYNDAAKQVTIGARNGSFTGMLKTRIFNIVYVTGGHGIADTITQNPDCVIQYSGTQVSGCPVGVLVEAPPVHLTPFNMTVKAATGYVVLDRAFAGRSKSVAVYSCIGKLVGQKVLKKNVIDLQRDFGITDGVYVLKINALP